MLARGSATAAFVLALLARAEPPYSAQTPASPSALPAFDVASIKPNTSGDGGMFSAFQPGGRFVATNMTVRTLIRSAYGTPEPLPEFRIAGGPDWIDSERFDVQAKVDLEPARDADGVPWQMILMLRSLLNDRFALKAHSETRELPIYALVVGSRDRKLGPKLRAVDIDCASVRAGHVAPSSALPPSGPPGPVCGTRNGRGNVVSRAATMDQLARALSMSLDRVVVNRTGLTSHFEMSLDWTPFQAPTAPGSRPNELSTELGAGVFTAIQEQLGLKLESTRGPVEVVIIDSVARPTPN